MSELDVEEERFEVFGESKNARLHVVTYRFTTNSWQDDSPLECHTST